MAKTDRRVQRTPGLLQKALVDFISESDYAANTKQDIVDRAHDSPPTLYVHFNNKKDLFMSCREAGSLHFGPPRHLLTREQLLSSEVPAGTISHFRHLNDIRALLVPIFQGEDGLVLLRRIRDESAQNIEASLHLAFAES